jgi:translation initiation factor 2B subunit (eIF-2B alpha/beta/delta family)
MCIRDSSQAWDSYLDDQVLALVADQVTEARARHAAAARTMVDKVAERLTEVDPSELSVSELARWIDVAVKVERLALGDAGQILETREVDVTAEVESRRERARSVIDTALERMAEDD